MTAIFGVVAGGIWLVWLDYEVRQTFDGRKWSLPAEVYAQPLELFEGAAVTEQELRFHLKHLGYQPVASVTRQGQWSLQGKQVELFIRSHRAGELRHASRRIRFRLDGNILRNLQVMEGQSSAVVPLEPALIGRIYPLLAEDRELIKLADIPPLLGEMLIAVEDRSFVDHHGISPRAIARAAWQNVRAGRVVQGGSTLTQQLVKNFFLTQSRSLSRKAKEAAMSMLLEWRYSKSEILETYLNEVYLGQESGRQIHGFGLAARHYFDADVAELQPEQLALLVGLVKGASYYNPRRHPQRATDRRNVVLDVAAREGLITAKQLLEYRSRPLGVVERLAQDSLYYPAFIQLVKRQLLREYSKRTLEEEGLSIYTTLSLGAQRTLERNIQMELASLEKSYGIDASSLESAAVLTSVGSGEILALAGGRNPRFQGFNRALDARRQVGSLVKPALYLAALSAEGDRHLASVISDEPVEVTMPDGRVWRPENFDRRSHGDVLLLDALSHSWNQATVRLGTGLGVDALRVSLSRLGVDLSVEELPSAFLGAFEMTPLQVADMYHTLANDGVIAPLRAIRTVVDQNGSELSRYPLQIKSGYSPAEVHLIQYALQTVMREGTGKNAYRWLPESLSVAGKTGTSNGQRDSWFAGFSADHLGVVWVGRDDNGETPLTGSSGAMRVWSKSFAELNTRGIEYFPDQDIRYLWVDGATGGLSSENCKGARLIPFRRGAEPHLRGECERIRNPVIHWLKKWL